MGTTKLMHMKASPGGNPSAHLNNAIDYILDTQHGHNQDKTLDGLLLGGNCGTTTKEIYDTMMATKNAYGKNWGRSGYHFVLTFAPGEVDAMTARDITSEFCEKYFGDDYDYVVAAHDDKAHKHGHIIFNSVSRHGKKYRYEKGDWDRYIQRLVNKICIEHGLSYIKLKEYDEEKSHKEFSHNTSGYNKWEQQRGTKCLRNLVRQNIDEAIGMSDSYDEFITILKNNGYKIKEGVLKGEVPYFSLNAAGIKGGVRNTSLGRGYSISDIEKRVENKELNEQMRQEIEDLTPKADRLRISYKNIKLLPLERYYYIRTTFLCTWNNKIDSPYPRAQPWKYRNELQKLDKHMQTLEYVSKNKIRSVNDVQTRKSTLENEIATLQYERKRHYNILDSDDNSGISTAYEQKQRQEDLHSIKISLKEKRQEMKLLDDVLNTHRIVPPEKIEKETEDMELYLSASDGEYKHEKAHTITENIKL